LKPVLPSVRKILDVTLLVRYPFTLTLALLTRLKAFVDGSCYMKNKKGDAVALGHVWGASLVNAATPVPETPTLTCVDKKDDAKVFNSPSGGTYLIACAIDYEGGDYSASVVSNFEACITACDAEPQCIDLSYVRLLFIASASSTTTRRFVVLPVLTHHRSTVPATSKTSRLLLLNVATSGQPSLSLPVEVSHPLRPLLLLQLLRLQV